jgi:3-isopropylmalate/(R)-2-methylmalate dehydratase small subunit
MLKGKAFKFGNDISTDLIIPGRFLHLRSNLPELAKHALEDADPTFVRRVKPGDFVVGGNNFGLGSSREHAPLVIKMAGVSAVLARSFARIFFRNAINIGQGTIHDLTNGAKLDFSPVPDIMLRILNEGGLVPYIQKHKDLVL